ncbi:trypsin-like peptidase domain-containing protein [Sphingomonas sp. MG17]|uniref:Trypsin-like peptidase domain-containing protein n=1 Tax=Sphingomonas tagetis TaxID=2949092 RepID=A0A9X2HHD7_9SPHN|nr:trypsin-like peptidase domain-containing protein [Sphingomonas tagetis]MCP3730868.1 trypsin-like peptidase domain-containing protein [Sphingomonas tagetis]
MTSLKPVNLYRRTLGWFLAASLCLGVALPSTARAAAMPQAAVAQAAKPETGIERAMKAVVAISPQDEAARKQNGDTESAGGSGFVIDASGLILTNAHVVAKLDKVEVTFANGKRYAGTVIGRDGRTDLAIVKIKPDGPLPVLKFAASSKLPLGTKVYALGNPLGNRFSVTSGIVSGYDRAYDVAWPVNFIQHDAALNPGNSGGPLITEEGDVIGINTATPPETIFDIGIGLAIPAELAAKIAPKLVADGKVVRGRLGVTASSADAGMAEALGAPGKTGLIVDAVTGGGAAEKAGVKIGDLLLSVEGRKLEVVRDLSMALIDTRPGDKVGVKVMRGGKPIDLAVALEPDEDTAGERGKVAALSMSDGLGSDGSFKLGFEFKAGASAGRILVGKVEEASIGQMYGLYEGDELLAIDGVAVTDPAAAMAAITGSKRSVSVLRIQRAGQGTLHIALPLSAEAAKARRPGVPRRFPRGPL